MKDETIILVPHISKIEITQPNKGSWCLVVHFDDEKIPQVRVWRKEKRYQELLDIRKRIEDLILMYYSRLDRDREEVFKQGILIPKIVQISPIDKECEDSVPFFSFIITVEGGETYYLNYEQETTAIAEKEEFFERLRIFKGLYSVTRF